jgi:hypothetical protein
MTRDELRDFSIALAILVFILLQIGFWLHRLVFIAY